MPAISGLDRARGMLIGQAVGDGLGAPFEGMPDEYIGRFGPASKVVAEPPHDRLTYTDDTQMAIGVAESLAEHGRIIEDALMATFAANYDPRRRYGFGARRLLQAHRDGEDWRALSETHYPGGSFGNGAAMRAAPVGLFFRDDLDRAAAEAAASARPTHRHPLGIDGARTIAVAAALAATTGPIDRRAFFGAIAERVETEEFRWQLEMAAQLRPSQSIAAFGNGIEAHRSAVTAVAAFAAAPDDYPTVLARVLALGGDVDTLAAMAGALCGARVGLDGIPTHLVALLEDGPKGRGYLFDLAARLDEAGRRHAARQ